MTENCPICDSPNIEQKRDERQSKDYMVCKDCKFGFRIPIGKSLDGKKVIMSLFENITLLKMLFPNDSNEVLVMRYSLHEHRVMNHPTDENGYCQWCEINWKEYPADKFKELLGYEKSKWI